MLERMVKLLTEALDMIKARPIAYKYRDSQNKGGVQDRDNEHRVDGPWWKRIFSEDTFPEQNLK